MTTGAPKRLMRGFLACLMVLLCSFGLCGCDFGDLFKTTKDKPAAQTEQVAPAEGEGAQEGEEAKSSESESAKPASSESGSSSSSQSASSGEASSDPEPEPEPEPEDATISIHVLVDASNAGRGYFFDATVELNEGATVYDALIATGLSFGGNSEYVRSINGLAEFDAGKTSGWMYSVNGNVPMTPCGGYTLSAGDNVRWYYVTNYGDM
ncbi:MAG: DUF4430 domain-containing protein [Eggerthellaceae bacterium]|nr:DUF4430 domain-containing protein [Eggerthellaceae bacterium]